jgi:S-adenosylmethionine decarboxylase
MKTYKTNWKHVVVDVWFTEMPLIDELVNNICRACKLTVVDRLVKYFKPQGETRLYLLSESHLTLHTYPEYNYVSIDIYTCGERGKPETITKVLQEYDITTMNYKILSRGGRKRLVIMVLIIILFYLFAQ